MDHKANRHRPIEVYLYDQMVIVFLEGDQAADCHNVRHYMTFALQVSPVRTPRTKTKSPREVDSSKSDQAPAGLLARGSQLDARPSQAPHDLASGPVAAPARRWKRCASRSPLTVAGTASDSDQQKPLLTVFPN